MSRVTKTISAIIPTRSTVREWLVYFSILAFVFAFMILFILVSPKSKVVVEKEKTVSLSVCEMADPPHAESMQFGVGGWLWIPPRSMKVQDASNGIPFSAQVTVNGYWIRADQESGKVDLGFAELPKKASN